MRTPACARYVSPPWVGQPGQMSREPRRDDLGLRPKTSDAGHLRHHFQIPLAQPDRNEYSFHQAMSTPAESKARPPKAAATQGERRASARSQSARARSPSRSSDAASTGSPARSSRAASA